jgi:hypothetical protein
MARYEDLREDEGGGGPGEIVVVVAFALLQHCCWSALH